MPVFDTIRKKNTRAYCVYEKNFVTLLPILDIGPK